MLPPSPFPFIHLFLELGAVAMQAEGEEGNQDHLGAVGWQAEAGVGRLLLHCSPLQPSLVVVLDKMDYQ